MMMKRFVYGMLGVVGLTVVVSAAASYPSSVKSFSTKLAGATISAAHINDLQDEVVAVEAALVNGFAHALKPTVSGAQDLGTSGLHWGTLYVNAINGASADFVCGRLTLTTATPVTTADVTAATTVYYTPDGCDLIALYDGAAAWTTVTFTELSVAVPATTSTMYDLWVYNNAGTATLEALAWTNDTTRATALTRQNGRYVKTGATTRRYVGSFRTTTVSGQTEDSASKRYVWNYYHRARRIGRVTEATDNWTYTTATWRQANAAAANQLDFVIGVADLGLHVETVGIATNVGGPTLYVGVGQDSTSAPMAGLVGVGGTGFAAGQLFQIRAVGDIYPAVGRHFYAWLERSQASGTTTWYGDNGDSTLTQSGIFGWIEG
jgi:hypothetical protein